MSNATMKHDRPRRETGSGFLGFIIRFAVAALVLMVTSYFVPGFVLRGFISAVVAALVIAAADYLIEKLFRIDASPLGRGLVGFLISAAIIYFSQYFVPNMEVSWLGALVGALVIGLIDAILPTRIM
ncbi:MAG: phage holin family protein [Bacillota bacterium]